MSVLYELKNTHRLLFHNMNAKHFTTTETCAVKNAGRRSGIMVHEVRVDINSSRARKILKHILNSPLPGKLGRGSFDNAKPRQLRYVWWPIDRALSILHSLTHRKPLPSTVYTYLSSGSPYPLDLCRHLYSYPLPGHGWRKRIYAFIRSLHTLQLSTSGDQVLCENPETEWLVSNVEGQT